MLFNSLLLALLPLSAPTQAGGVAVYIAIPEYGVPRLPAPKGRKFPQETWRRQLPLGDPQAHFEVVIRNTSNRPLEFWSDGCSLGDTALSFEAQIGNRSVDLRKRILIYASNPLRGVRLMPGEVWCRDIYYNTGTWDDFRKNIGRSWQPVALTAVLSQSDSRPNVWSGMAKSQPIKVAVPY